jgi:hypothetical protein
MLTKPKYREKVMKEKKALSAEEIEAQMLIELPDRTLMGAENEATINIAIQIIKLFFDF